MTFSLATGIMLQKLLFAVIPHKRYNNPSGLVEFYGSNRDEIE